MITSVSIENFRGIEKLSIKDLGRINVIVGKNNAGKSTIIEALSLILGAGNSPSSFTETLQEILIWRGWYGPQSLKDVFYKNSTSSSIAIVLREGNKTSELRLTLKNKNKNSDDISVSFEMKPTKHWSNTIFSHSLVNDKAISSLLVSSKFTPEMGFGFLTPLTLRKFGYVESLYSRAYEGKVVKESVKVLQSAYPEVEGFSPLLKFGRWILHVETNTGVYPYYLMGEGFKNAMIVAFLSSLLRNGVLLIDSAEAFHHPSSLRVMVKTLVSGVKKNKVQVFLTTHSLELLDTLLEYSLDERLDGRVIYMKRQKKGRIMANVESFEDANELRETIGLDLRG